MFTRRYVLSAAAAFSLGASSQAQQPNIQPSRIQPGEDGLYHFDWYLESFLDLGEDLDGAASNGKRLAVLFSQRGCIYCKRMAEDYFSQAKIVDYIRANFEVLHFDIYGAREVTDFDGKKMTEKALAQRYGVRLTPTFLFFPEKAEGLSAREIAKREVARMPGLLQPAAFLAMFRYVRDKSYEKSGFNEWLKAQG